jgi:hypothetical protein
MIRTILLRLGPTLVVTAGFTPGPPVPVTALLPGNMFRVDEPAGGSSLFRIAA